MTSGFYVSPCGKHIIEINYVMNIHTHRAIIDFDGSHMSMSSFSSELRWHLETMLSCWEFLGTH